MGIVFLIMFAVIYGVLLALYHYLACRGQKYYSMDGGAMLCAGIGAFLLSLTAMIFGLSGI